MKAAQHALLTLAAAAVFALAGCTGDLAAATSGAAGPRSGSVSDRGQVASQLASASQDDGGGKGNKGKDNKGKSDKGKEKKEKDQKGNERRGTPDPDHGQGNKDRSNNSRGGAAGQDTTGWQRGRFSSVIPFAYLPVWQVERRGDGLALRGEWDDRDYVVEVSRAMRVNQGPFEEWLGGQLDQLGVDERDVEYAAAGRVQIAVVSDLDLVGYDCPAARAFLWTQNPAGRNERVVVVTVSQAEGEACDSEALRAFVVELATRSLDRELPGGNATPVATAIPGQTATPQATAAPQATATAQPGWQQGQVGPVRLPLPGGWTLTNQGNTGVAQGQFEGRSYVIQAVPYTNIEQDSLKDWVESQTGDLGLDANAVQYTTAGGLQVAVLRNLDRDDDLYRCPVARIYVWLQGGGATSSGAIVTVAQMGLQQCDPAALDRLVSELLRQAQR